MKSGHILLFLVFLFLSSASIFLCFGLDFVSNQYWSDCLLYMLFLIGCVELSLLVFFFKRCHVFSKGEGTKEDSRARMEKTKAWCRGLRTRS